MSLFSIKHLKKDQTSKNEKIYVNTVITGKGPYTVLLWDRLFQAKQKNDLLFISRDRLTPYDLCPWGPAPLRGEANIAYYKNLFSLPEGKAETGKTVFFKDLEFREFGGRYKPEPLLFAETFYTQKSGFPDYDKIFPYRTSEDFLTLLNELVCTELILKIEKLPKDGHLINEKRWLVTFASGNQVECENLIWGAPIFELFEVLDAASLFDLKFIEFHNNMKEVSSLFMTFEVSQASSSTDTFFIPLSYTHEWGHFIGEFQGSQVELVHFLNRESVTEDEIAKRIKIFKRSFEKIFPQHKIIESTEFIYFDSESPIIKMSDDNDYQFDDRLFFVGINAPLKGESNHLSNMARALASVKNIENFLGV
ncbi:MAG: hypothetical protein A2381_03470 [Bdellovibrionales bacterium RIFOXYB1_FULL_37_110]|nr:MAG: hypothetical protein A2181_06205 [Bdellovibrionales bacterium RIFOXYA1_FULL_38_20]OFZ48465.1 MAG: hypothetical protein A2417_03960 [Bdellovibrionales bacterium RIFOXYC1_FULL_37_79]OFZ57986.1 MAG: hypothetical protein A2381_03470 [Bdellovibrionales bacterium RIFOXYB1_FULL_37_110]OFZ63123.1 MAG: hypothetical protein A2577_15600 [Bdellovibrionales bacterium RIFOXYD1_FULL_36_51]